MREILFRAKTASTDNPEWVEGYYIFDGTHWIERMSEEYPGHTESIPINYETLGEFIGRRDKNGKKMFEGDIIKDPLKPKRSYRIVVFNNWEARFVGKSTSKIIKENIPFNILDEYEVIGNIYDNPELLEVNNA